MNQIVSRFFININQLKPLLSCCFLVGPALYINNANAEIDPIATDHINDLLPCYEMAVSTTHTPIAYGASLYEIKNTAYECIKPGITTITFEPPKTRVNGDLLKDGEVTSYRLELTADRVCITAIADEESQPECQER